MLRPILIITLFLSAFACESIAQNSSLTNGKLRNSIAELTGPYKAVIGIAIQNIETGDTLTFNNVHHYPMQSVYKFPLAMAVLDNVDHGKLKLNQRVRITKKDLAPFSWSPLKKKYPEGCDTVTIAELLYFSVSISDNLACDLLFRVMKGPAKVNAYIHQLGYNNIAIKYTEQQMHKEWENQYYNWCEPLMMTKLLTGFYEKKYLSDSSTRYLMHLMTESSNSPLRIKGLLPEETTVAHKTGTSDTNSLGMRAGLNDVGIITLPNGQHLAISLLVSDSYETYERDEKIIALIAKATYDHYNK